METNKEKQNINHQDDMFEEIFKMGTDMFFSKESEKESELYVPNLQKSKDGIYKAIIRFLPNVFNPKEPFVKKYVYWLRDPITGESFSVDCPSNVNKPSILQELFFRYNSSKSYEEKEYAKYFKRSVSYYSLVQIIKDDNDPDIVNTIKVFRYGQKIYNMIKGELESEIEDVTNPFDPLMGKNFYLVVTKVANNNNYDQSKFLSKPSPIVIDGKPISNTKEDKIKLYNYLKENSPSLDNYKFKEWTEDKTQKVYSYIKHVLPQKEILKINMLSNDQNISNENINSSINDSKSESQKYQMQDESVRQKPNDIHTSNINNINDNIDDDDFLNGIIDDIPF